MLKVIKKVNRPWGYFEVLEKTPTFWIKKIVVRPEQALSLQKHRKRDEFWKIVSGLGTLQIENENYLVQSGHINNQDEFTIHRGTAHRITNMSDFFDLIFYEIAEGLCEENDIVRLEDRYGR
ncbi:MAG: phosphomannose isomerase type II C-terminal cupin domain [Proteobacteria bacterium]|jgi:mannose-6-phosphate isomerase-like protein (cupin superfamily)|nr:phosphomannose isomerase type II C-terminal cupin domain [Pseudomonadota bacterium]